MEEDNPLYYKLTVVNAKHDQFCSVASGGEESLPSPYTRNSGGKFTEVFGPVCKRIVSSRCNVLAGLGDGFATLSREETLVHRPYMIVARCWQEKRAFFLPTFEQMAAVLEREVVASVTNWLLTVKEVGFSYPLEALFTRWSCCLSHILC